MLGLNQSMDPYARPGAKSLLRQLRPKQISTYLGCHFLVSRLHCSDPEQEIEGTLAL
jgi:hypothetical protein